ncbi:MAG: hypothetical protein DRR42_24615 [Gammaproteobacteria bacterium]|nr:MAG: hypothetical protein DRR42_24615 [Gammaproteobacteria bacterium]
MEYIQLTEQKGLPGIGHFAPFKIVLAIEDVVGPSRQNEVSNWLVEMGGKCVMICGDHCKSWEQSIRQANLDQVDIENMGPQEFVMITTHEHDRLRNVFWHAKHVARHSHVKINNILTIHIGSQDRSVEYLAMFEKA